MASFWEPKSGKANTVCRFALARKDGGGVQLSK